jgi:hypothetical protein
MKNLTAAQHAAIEQAADFALAGFGSGREISAALARTLGTDEATAAELVADNIAYRN